MDPPDLSPVTISVDDAHAVSGLLSVPPRAHACYVLAHGAGAGMSHPFMEAVAAELGRRCIFKQAGRAVLLTATGQRSIVRDLCPVFRAIAVSSDRLRE